MKIHAYLFQCLEKLFIVAVLVLYTGGPLPLLRAGQMDDIEGDPLFQMIYFGVYVITAFLVLLRINQATEVAFADKFLLVLVGLAVLSTFWSYAPELTIRRGIALFGTTLFGIYLALRFSLDQLLRLVAYACAVILAFSLFFGLFLPSYGIMQESHLGAWQGAFTHKNQLGRMMAFSVLVFSLTSFTQLWLRSLFFLGRILAVTLIVLSTSTSALVVSGSTFVALILSRLLRWRSTVALAAGLSLTAFGGLTGLYLWDYADIILAGFGRDLTFTGRTELWLASLEAARSQLWLGHGYTGFWLGWAGESAQVWSAVQWEPPDAHNGWLNLLLDLGIVGAVLFSLTFFLAFYRAILWVRLNRSGHTYWPLVLLFFLLMSNFTEGSFLVRNNIFWALQVAVTLHLASQVAVKRKVIVKHAPAYPLGARVAIKEQ
jgi:O-antigen ligase